MLIPLVCSLVLAVSVAAPDDAPRVQVETRDGRILEGALSELRDGRLRIETSSGPSSVSLSEVLLLSIRPCETPPGDPTGTGPAPGGLALESAVGPPDLLLLATPSGRAGDRLVGRVVGGDTFGLSFAIDGGVTLEVPFEEIERLLPSVNQPVDRLALLAGGGADDRLWLRRSDGSLDSLTGVVASVNAGVLTFESALDPLDFGLPEVLAVVFAPSPAAARPLPGAPVVLRLSSGTRLQGGLLELGPSSFTLSTRLAERLTLPTAALVSLVQRGSGTILLADLSPVEVDERPSIGGPEDFLFPWRAEHSVTGRPLSVGGLLRATGLGVHSNSRLVFELPPGVSVLRVTVGLCDEVTELPAQGSVSFEILVDGERRAYSGVLREGDPAKVLRINDLADASTLTLVVSDAGDDDAGDRAAWVDGVLLVGRK